MRSRSRSAARSSSSARCSGVVRLHAGNAAAAASAAASTCAADASGASPTTSSVAGLTTGEVPAAPSTRSPPMSIRYSGPCGETRTRSNLRAWRPTCHGSSRSTTTSWNPRPCGPTASRRSTSTGAPGSSATGRCSTSRAASSPTSRACAGRRVVRLVALRRPRLPVPEAVGGRRVRRARRHARRPTTRSAPAAGSSPIASPTWTANHVDASICFPNTLPRFAGQTFDERADKDLALLCVAGLQRLDDRRVVRGRGQGPAASR